VGRRMGAAEWGVCSGRFWDGEPVPYGRDGGWVALKGVFVPGGCGGSKLPPYIQHSQLSIHNSAFSIL